MHIGKGRASGNVNFRATVVFSGDQNEQCSLR
jgi:hypothetical protein